MRPVILACLGACSLALGVAAWQIDIVGTATRSTDLARAIAVDAGGHVVIAGVTQNSGIPQDFTVLKVDGSSGAELWRQVIHGTASSTQGSDGANAVALDAAGDVFAAGELTNADTGADFVVVKFDEVSGVELWRQTINGTANGFDMASTVAVDAAGDVLAAGFLANTGTGSDFTVIKFHGGSGTELWRQSITDTSAAFDAARAVVVDADDNVIAAGVFASTGTGNNFAVVKFDGQSGAELWRRSIHGTAFGTAEASAVAVDAAGDVVAAGALTNAGTLTDFTVAKFDGASGAEQWRKSINGLADGHEEARTVAVDAAGDVVAAGALTNDLGRDFSVVKFEGVNGAELWRRDDIATGSSGTDFASAVALDAAGDVVAAGRLEREPNGFTVLKVDGASGAERWRQIITGNSSSNFANAVAVDALGDVVAAGGVATTDREGDFTVVKFDGTSGSQRWRQQLNGSSPHINSATAMAVDAAGDVVAAGALTNAETDSDFTVLKLDGANGAERWRQVLNGTANGFDRANAVVVDAAGDVVAAGMISDTGATGGFTVLKLRGHSGAERWRQVVHGPVPGFESVNAVVVDAAGNVIAAGLTTYSGVAPGLTNFTVVKLDKATGAEHWRQVIIGPLSGFGDAARAVAVDALGDVMAVGAITTIGSSRGFTVVKLDSVSGAEQWRYIVTGTAASGSSDGASAVAVDAAGNVIAAGALTNTDTQGDFTVLKVNGASGAELWRKTLNGTANGFDRANAVALDAAGDVVAAGFLANAATGSDFTVVKFDRATGAERWRQVVPSPSGCCVGGAQTVTVDAAGDVVAAGWTTEADGAPNFFTVIKFDGASGVERWRRIIPTPSGCCLSGVSAVDAEGDVVAAGSVQDNDGSHYIVVKLRGTDGGDFGTNACKGSGSFRLRGRVRTPHRSELPEVTLTLTGPEGCQETTITSSVGHYVFRKLGSGTYTLTAAAAGCSFVPPSRTVTLEQGNLQANFRGTCLETGKDPNPEPAVFVTH